MTTAEIITIGTELLLGEIQDKNTSYLAKQFRALGIDLFRVTTVGDNTLRIADTIRESLSRADIVITTGGLGPTIDDPTRNAVAIAINTDVVFHPELWEKILDRFNQRGITPSENNQKQAFLPDSAIAIENPVGTAPAFYIFRNNKMIICLPGVPAEIETIFQNSVISILQQHFSLTEIIKTRILHTSGLGESLVDELVADLETLKNPTVGLSAHPASVDIRITAKSSNELDSERMIEIIENQIRERLPDAIYGTDHETLDQVISKQVQKNQFTPQFYLFGCTAATFSLFFKNIADSLHFRQLDQPFTLLTNLPETEKGLFFALNFIPGDELSSLELFFLHDDEHDIKVSSYNGPVSQTDRWLVNTSLDFIWRKLRIL